MKNKKNIDYSIYLVTDRELMSTKTLEEAVSLAVEGGCTLVQLREKDCSSLEFYETALKIKKICDKFNVPLIINDRVDIAMAVDADGVHIGQSDLPADVVRKIIGEDKIVGVSAGDLEKAVKAEKDGADYIGVGAMYATDTKKDAKRVTLEQLKRIRNEVSVPIVVIGGINQKTLNDFKGMDINGAAVVSAIISKSDIKKAASDIKKIWSDL